MSSRYGRGSMDVSDGGGGYFQQQGRNAVQSPRGSQQPRDWDQREQDDWPSFYDRRPQQQSGGGRAQPQWDDADGRQPRNRWADGAEPKNSGGGGQSRYADGPARNWGGNEGRGYQRDEGPWSPGGTRSGGDQRRDGWGGEPSPGRQGQQPPALPRGSPQKLSRAKSQRWEGDAAERGASGAAVGRPSPGRGGLNRSQTFVSPRQGGGPSAPGRGGIRRVPSNYVPIVRSVKQLYIEDDKQAENYSRVADDDEEVTVKGGGEVNVVMSSWDDANFDAKLLKNVQNCCYVRPRKIQSYAIPLIIDGRDVKGQSETGSGKTAAFMLPIIDHLLKMERTATPKEKPSPYAVIIEPTRELCLQVYEQGKKFVNGLGVSICKSYGQYSVRENLNEMESGCDILCVTPSRLKHLYGTDLIKLNKLKFFVLDEADALLEGNFIEDVKELIAKEDFPKPDQRQTLLFSATFPDFVDSLCDMLMRPERVIISNQKQVAANHRVEQKFYAIDEKEKKDKLLSVLRAYFEEAKQNDPEAKGPPRVLVFVRTKRDADMLALYLSSNGIKSLTINSDRPQHLRERALKDLRENNAPVLVATDVMARGIDIKDLDHVINFDLPSDRVTYVHRIGRTGRVKPGLATSFFDQLNTNDAGLAAELTKLIGEAGKEVPSFLQACANGTATGNSEAQRGDRDAE